MRAQKLRIILPIIPVLVGGCAAHLNDTANSSVGTFRVIRNESGFVLVDVIDSQKCIDAITSVAIESKLKKYVDKNEPVTPKYKSVDSIKIHDPTIVIVENDPVVSSGAWIEIEGKQTFLQCSVDNLYRIVEIYELR